MLAATTSAPLAKFTTKYTADSVETNPAHRSTFACATYQLDSSSGARLGNVALLAYHKDKASNAETQEIHTPCLTESSTLETGGVLDLWWQDSSHLYTANASGHAQLLTVTEGQLALTHSTAVTDSILLAVDGGKGAVITSDTGGKVYLMAGHEVVCSIAAHGAQGWGAEVWGLALDRHNPHLVYTGGDDCLLKCHDFRSKDTVFLSKYHDMGVCCISPCPVSPHHILSGSYDETVVSWDTRSMKRPLESCKVGGGVWRMKRSPDNTRLLVAGMHSGFHVLHLETLEVERSYVAHGSLAYGADWLSEGVVATCSFYDNLLHVWES